MSGTADDGWGLEAPAEDGDAGPYAEITGGTVFAIPARESEPGPLFPGHTYTVEIEAEAGQNLTFATIFVQSSRSSRRVWLGVGTNTSPNHTAPALPGSGTMIARRRSRGERD